MANPHIPLTPQERAAICMAPEMALPSVIIRLLTDLQNAEADRDLLANTLSRFGALKLSEDPAENTKEHWLAWAVTKRGKKHPYAKEAADE